MITHLKIRAAPIKGISMEQLYKKLETGKTVTGIDTADRHLFKLEMETDLDTIKKVIEYIQELGRVAHLNG
jgi:hypothetical protein